MLSSWLGSLGWMRNQLPDFARVVQPPHDPKHEASKLVGLLKSSDLKRVNLVHKGTWFRPSVQAERAAGRAARPRQERPRSLARSWARDGRLKSCRAPLLCLLLELDGALRRASRCRASSWNLTEHCAAHLAAALLDLAFVRSGNGFDDDVRVVSEEKEGSGSP